MLRHYNYTLHYTSGENVLLYTTPLSSIEMFQNSLVSFDEFCQDPSSLFTNPKLVVRVEGKYYSWQVAAPMIMSAIVYLQVLPMGTHKKLVNKFMPKKVNGWGGGCG